METNERSTQSVTRAQSVINRSAVKAYALKVSKERKGGKFTRVGEDFLDAVEAQVESVIRGLTTFQGAESDVIFPDDDREFITGAALEKFRERLNERTRTIVSGLVRRHPSIGCTLKA